MRYVWGGCLLGLVGLVLLSQFHTKEGIPEVGQAAAAKVPAASKDEWARSNTDVVHRQNSVPAVAMVDGAVEEESVALPDLVDRYMTSYQMPQQGDFIEYLEQNPALLDNLQAILVDPKRAEKLMGERQHELRVVAVDLLVRWAASVDSQPLLDVHRQLAAAKLAGDPGSSRSDMDRLELFKGYVKARGEQVLDHLPGFLADVGYEPGLGIEYENILWQSFKRSVPRERLDKALAVFQ